MADLLRLRWRKKSHSAKKAATKATAPILAPIMVPVPTPPVDDPPTGAGKPVDPEEEALLLGVNKTQEVSEPVWT